MTKGSSSGDSSLVRRWSKGGHPVLMVIRSIVIDVALPDLNAESRRSAKQLGLASVRQHRYPMVIDALMATNTNGV